MAKKYWLLKTEPNTYSIDDLQVDKREPWDGIRNYQARNFMRDDMQCGDGILIYHSNAKPTGIVGSARVSKEAFTDVTAFDSNAKYFDAKSDPKNPRWVCVEVEFVEKFATTLRLEELKTLDEFADMLVVQRGQRLSIQPVDRIHFSQILKRVGAKKKV